jgi:hypothetical protein
MNLNLSKNQKILFISALTAIIIQTFSIYCLTDDKENFKIDKCFLYIFFSALAYLSYYKMMVI